MMKHIYSMLALLGIAGTAGAQTPVETQLKAADIVPGKTIVLKSVSELHNHYFMTTGNFTKLYSPGACNFTVEAATYNEDNSGKYFRLKVGNNYLKANSGNTNTETTTNAEEAAIFYTRAITETTTSANGITLGDCLPNTDINYLVRFVRADADLYLNCGQDHIKYANGKGGYSAFYVYDSTDTDAIIGAHACYTEAPKTVPASVDETEKDGNDATLYYIYNPSSSRYCGTITNSTQSINSAEGFIFVNTDIPHVYKIWSVTQQQYLTFSNHEAGAGKIITDGTGTNDKWWVRANEGWETNSTEIDILPYGEFTQSWNWYGGANANANRSMGLFSYSNGQSKWSLIGVRENALSNIEIGTGLGQYNNTIVPLTEAVRNSSGTALLTAANNLRSGFAASLNIPAANSFLRIKGSTTGNYLLNGTTSGTYSTGTDADAAIFYYDGTYLVNYQTGLYVGVDRNSWAWPAAGQPGRKIQFGAGLNTIGKYYVKTYTTNDDDAIYLYDKTGNHADRGQSNDGHARYNSWELSYVQALPLNIGGTGFATLWSPVSLTAPADAEVYTATLNEDNSTLKLTLVEAGSTIPAGTGVVVKGTANTSVQFGITESDASTVGSLKGNDHATVFNAEDFSGTIYTLQGLNEEEKSDASDVVGFKKFTGTTSPAFRAYLEVPATVAAQALHLVFGDTTGILSAPASDNGAAAIYDLSGRRVHKASKGIYIVNGKKTIIK